VRACEDSHRPSPAAGIVAVLERIISERRCRVRNLAAQVPQKQLLATGLLMRLYRMQSVAPLALHKSTRPALTQNATTPRHE
jgi:hypothetical protein